MVRTLKLRARHFKTANFASKWSANLPSGYCGCPIERAASEEFAMSDVEEIVSRITIGDDTWLHERYGYDKYDEDAMKATELNHSDDVIREIEITRQEQPEKGVTWNYNY